MKFFIYTHGDQSVGIAGDEVTVEINIGEFAYEEDRKDFIEVCKSELATAFSTIWDFKAFVRTEEDLTKD